MPKISESDLALLQASAGFDAAWYLAQYPDVAKSGLGPAEHYLWIGKRLGRLPAAGGISETRNPLVALPVATKPSPPTPPPAAATVRSSEIFAAWRRIAVQLSAAHNAVRGRIPPAARPGPIARLQRLIPGLSMRLRTPVFSRKWLQAQLPELGKITVMRYLRDASLFDLDPHPLFAAKFYLSRNADVARAGMNPLRHYLRYGWRESRDPHPCFTNDWYLSQNPDVLAAGLNPLEHYLQTGWTEGRWPNPVFDPRAYLERHPDVARAGVEPLTHYLRFGRGEHRELPIRDCDPSWLQRLPAGNDGGDLMQLLLSRSPLCMPETDAPMRPPTMDGVAGAPGDQAWPPAPLDDYWLTQRMRDFIVERHGESQVPLYRYLCSVMHRYQDDKDGFSASTACRTILSRIQAMAAVGHVARPDATIIVPVYNNILDTLLCLLTALETRGERSFEIIVADDGSSDATAELIPRIGGVVRHLRQPKNLGFLGNCNTAAVFARGKYVVLLNNDTLVLPGWLDRLLDPFERFDKVGMTGSKLLCWDGTLQEAGGIYWNDGSAWNFGRGQDALAGQFNYLKDVDYCSGAAIAVPLTLWNALGGFDPLYTPAYCEDSDLAFRIRDKGWRTLYQPFSEVIHHEGRSHGREVSSGIKAYQITNQAKLFERWQAVLERDHFANAQNVFRARDRSFAKRHILIVDHYVPQPDRDAGSRSVFSFIESLLAMGWAVSFWPDNLYNDRPYVAALQRLGVEVLFGHELAGKFDDFCAERHDLYDIILLSRPHIAPKYIDSVRRHTRARLMYYGHDIHFQRMQRSADLGLEGAPEPAEIAEVRASELAVCNASDFVVYPSREEAEFMAAHVKPGVVCRPISAYCFSSTVLARAQSRVSVASASPPGPLRLLFVGGFGHHPNVDGILWFCAEIAPLLRASGIAFALKVAGSNATAEIFELAAGDIEILGFVTDAELAALYDEAAIVVAPLRYGAGVKGKVVEAMANGVPVVTTSVGAQGLGEAEDGLFLGDTTEEFVAALIAATDRSVAMTKAGKALDFIRLHYSHEAIGRTFFEALGQQ